MKRVTAVLTVLAMLLMMTACGGTQSDVSVVGKWQGEVDYAGVVNAFMAENDVLAASGATLDGASVTATYTFLEDGTATCELDKTALNDKLMVVFKEILTPMMGMLGGTSVDEYIAQSGQTNEELIRSLFTDAVYDSIVNAFRFEGTYEMKNGKLAVTVNGHTAQSKVTLDGETLTVASPVGTTTTSALQETAVKALFPLTLKKVG